MPTASENLRNLMEKWFGDPIDDAGPLAFLRARGWRDRGGNLTPPVSAYTPSYYEWRCIHFLVDEWDHTWSPMRQHQKDPDDEEWA